MAKPDGRHRGSPLSSWLILAVLTVGLVLGWLSLSNSVLLPRGVDVALRLPLRPRLPSIPNPEPLPLPPGTPRV